MTAPPGLVPRQDRPAHQSHLGPAASRPAQLLLVLDGNSLLHRAYHAASDENMRDESGRPIWALWGLVRYVARAAAYLRPDAVIVGFDPKDKETATVVKVTRIADAGKKKKKAGA